MKNLNSEETLWVILPILVVVGLLIASIIILPQTQTEVRSKASEPITTPTKAPTPSISERPEIICTALYSPVCSQAGVTYSSECEANNAGVTAFTQGECKTKVIKTVTPTPQILPASN